MADPRITDASFKGLTFHVAVPAKNSPFGVMSQEIVNERRLQISEKPLIDGAEVEDFGRKPRMFSAEVIFFGDNYLELLRAFEAKLNEGSSGTLILPDLDEAVVAKYQKHTRKSSAQDGNSTLLSVSWVEDKTVRTAASLFTPDPLNISTVNGKTEDEKKDEVNHKADLVKDAVAATRNLLENNSYLQKITDAQNAVSSQQQTVSSIANLPGDTKNLILGTVSRFKNETDSLQSAMNGLRSYNDILKNNEADGSPTRYNTGLGLADFVSIGVATTTVVSGSAKVVNAVKLPEVVIQSYTDASSKLKASLAVVKSVQATLQKNTKGATDDIVTANIILINSIQDLIKTLDDKSSKQILTESPTSLIELCFRNGLKVKDVNRVHLLNTQIDDILDIPRYTVVNL